MARSSSVNVLIGGLVVWALTVLLWMTILSRNWNAVDCRDGKQELKRSSGKVLFTPSSASPSSSGTPQAPPSSTPQTPLAKRLLYYSSQIESNLSDTKENCTMVVQTYRRTEILPKFLNHYCKIPGLQKILVVWNSVNETLPGTIKWWASRCRTELSFIVSSTNKLTNRYIPRKEIETDCK